MVSIDPEMLASSLRRLSSAAAHQDVSAAVDEAVHACAALFRVTGSGLMIVDDQHNLHYVAASDGPGRVLEHVQSETGVGPCVEAFITDDIVISDDLNTEPRWPEVTKTLTRHGIVSVLGCPLRFGGVPVGTLDVYRDRPHAWDESERAALARYSDVIESTLRAAVDAHRAGELAGQLQYALDYRVVIERAVGFLMARHELDSVTAFDTLRRAARNRRRKVVDVARELLDSGAISQ